MKRRWIALCMALMTLVGVFGAAQAVDLSRTNSLTVRPGADSIAEDLAKADVVVDLYYVASANKVSGYDTYNYLTQSAFSTLRITDDITNSGWTALAQQAANLVFAAGSTIKPTYSSQPVNTAINGLDSGLYLVIAHGREFTTADENQSTGYVVRENSNVFTRAQSAQYSYTFAPELVSLPGKTTGNTAGGSWVYDEIIQLKPEREDRLGSLEIIKQLTSYETSSPATFVFDVTVTRPGQQPETNPCSITFTEAGQKSILIENLPVGTQVTVTEVYSGSSYTVTTSQEQKATIEANKVVSVSFTNTYDEHQRKGHGIQNHFAYERNTDGGLRWNWTQQ